MSAAAEGGGLPAAGTVAICRRCCSRAALLRAVRSQESDYPPPVEGDFVIRDFQFASGESLPELRIHYRTLGTPRATRTAWCATRC